MPESWLELELFLEDSSLLTFTSRLSLLFLFVPDLRPPGTVLLRFLGEPPERLDPEEEFFSAAVRDSSRLLVWGVRPAPEEGREPVLVAEDGEWELLAEELELFMLLRRLLEDLPAPRRPSPTSWSWEWSLDFIVTQSMARDWIVECRVWCGGGNWDTPGLPGNNTDTSRHDLAALVEEVGRRRRGRREVKEGRGRRWRWR